jgi:hypothetical protein
MAKAASNVREVELRIPDLKLTKPQMTAMKKKFENEIVTSLGSKAAIVVIRVRIRVVVVLAEF